MDVKVYSIQLVLHLFRQMTHRSIQKTQVRLAQLQAELIDPGVKGTLNVLRSCAKVRYIKRVVVTSSMSSILYSGTPLTPDLVVDETWFSNPEVCIELKTLTVEAAWKFAKENEIDLEFAQLLADLLLLEE